MTTRTLYAQGDILLERVADLDISRDKRVNRDPDGAVVLARGEATGHRHAFYGAGVAMFRDDALARDVPAGLYLGHVKVGEKGASLEHEEHATIDLPPGTYRVRRQREFDSLAESRIVAD